MEQIISIEDLSFKYNSRQILDSITFEVFEGAFYGVIGPNGAGKTTLLKNIMKLLTSSKGEIYINGSPLSNFTIPELSQKISYLKQEPLASDIEVFEYILMGRSPYMKNFQLYESKQDHDIAEKYIELLELEELVGKKLHELSGGEKQLVQLARNLTQETPIMLIDEPTSHLDISHQIQILNILHDINKEMNKTILLVLHDLNMAGEYCDQILLLKQGQVYCEGKPEEVLTYQNIEDTFDTWVIVKENPLSGKPYIIPVTRKMKKDNIEDV